MNSARHPTIHVGVMLVCSSAPHLERFATTLARDLETTLEDCTGIDWDFHMGENISLESDEDHRAADFVSEASLRLTEGSFDLMLVISDVPLLSGDSQIVSGLASPLTRIAVMSTRQLRKTGRGEPLPLDEPSVRWNAATLALGLIGQVLGVGRPASKSGPFVPDPARTGPEWLDSPADVKKRAQTFSEHEYKVPTAFSALVAHLRSFASNPALVLKALWRNKAPLLALSLPGLAAAAVAPIFLLVFTAEFWDAGLGMSNKVAAIYAIISIVGATFYLTFGQKLFLPRKDNRVLPEHLGLANVVIFATILLGVIGLFVMVALLTLAIELWVFPADLIATWPTLQDPVVNIVDKIRLASFISTIGVTTGALAGGLQRRQVMRHLVLFQSTV